MKDPFARKPKGSAWRKGGRPPAASRRQKRDWIARTTPGIPLGQFENGFVPVVFNCSCGWVHHVTHPCPVSERDG
jgi:hypothetical protein